jgi:hypothetical protein
MTTTVTQHLINLGKRMEDHVANAPPGSYWRCVAFVRTEGVLLELSKNPYILRNIVAWEKIEAANFDILDDQFTKMVEDINREATRWKR